METEVFPDFTFPIIKNCGIQSMADKLQSVKPMSFEEYARGRKVIPYPEKYDDFADYNSLKQYIINMMHIDKDLCADWLEISTGSLMPFNLREDVCFSSVDVITIEFVKPRREDQSILDRLYRKHVARMNPDKWSSARIQTLIDAIKNGNLE